jgi:hypothetical protein
VTESVDGSCQCLADALLELAIDGSATTIEVVGGLDALTTTRLDELVGDAVAARCERLVLVAPTPLPLHAGGSLQDAATVSLAEAGIRNAAVRLAPGGTANLVLMGPLDIAGRCGAGCHGVVDDQRALVEAESITGRLSTPAEVAAAVGFLASDAAAYVSGIVFPVDGGLSAGRHA